MAARNPETIALEALANALADPAPKPLHGTAAKPGIFQGAAQATKNASALALKQGWVEQTGQFVGKGKAKKPLYRLTARGIQHTLEQGEPASTLRSLLTSMGKQETTLTELGDGLRLTRELLDRHREVVESVSKRLAPPDLSSIAAELKAAGSAGSAKGPGLPAGWPGSAAAYLKGFAHKTRHGHCPLPELFAAVAQPLGMTIGQFHDGIRELVAKRDIALHPYTGARYALQDEKYALLAGQEIQYYAEWRGH